MQSDSLSVNLDDAPRIERTRRLLLFLLRSGCLFLLCHQILISLVSFALKFSNSSDVIIPVARLVAMHDMCNDDSTNDATNWHDRSGVIRGDGMGWDGMQCDPYMGETRSKWENAMVQRRYDKSLDRSDATCLEAIRVDPVYVRCSAPCECDTSRTLVCVQVRVLWKSRAQTVTATQCQNSKIDRARRFEQR